MNPSFNSPRDRLLLNHPISTGVSFNLLRRQDSEVAAASALASLVGGKIDAYSAMYPFTSYTRTPKKVEVKSSSKDEFKVPQRFTKNGRKRAIPFPLKLMKLLSEEHYSHIISWMPNGKSFVILRPKAFVAEVLPKYFKSAQFASFVRKLIRWGFTRCEDGTNEYYHPQFLEGRVDLAEKMACYGPGSSNKKAAEAKDEAKNRLAASDSEETANESRRHSQSFDSAEEESVQTSKKTEKTSKSPKSIWIKRSSMSVPDAPGPSNSLPSTQSRPIVNTRTYTDKNTRNPDIEIELETLRLKRYIQASNYSRKAMEELELSSMLCDSSSWRGRTQSLGLGNSSRAFALAAGGFPVLSASSSHIQMPSNWHRGFHSTLSRDHFARDYVHRTSLRPLPNTSGAKSA